MFLVKIHRRTFTRLFCSVGDTLLDKVKIVLYWGLMCCYWVVFSHIWSYDCNGTVLAYIKP